MLYRLARWATIWTLHWHSRSTKLAAHSASYWIQSVCPVVQVSATWCRHFYTRKHTLYSMYKHLHQAAPTYLAELCSSLYESPAVVTSVLLRVVSWQYHAPEQPDMAKMFCCFYTNLVELTHNSWPNTDFDSVLCTFDNCVILQSMQNTSLVHPWQLRL